MQGNIQEKDHQITDYVAGIQLLSRPITEGSTMLDNLGQVAENLKNISEKAGKLGKHYPHYLKRICLKLRFS